MNKKMRDNEAAISRLVSTQPGMKAIVRAIRGLRRYERVIGKTFMHSDGTMWLVTEIRHDMTNGYLAVQVGTGANRLITYYQLRRHYASINHPAQTSK